MSVDHATINRWVIKYSPQLEEAFHRRKQPVWVSWRLDETYLKVKGEWGIHVERDTLPSIAYSEELIFPISATLQSTDRHHGIVGQECCHYQLDS